MSSTKKVEQHPAFATYQLAPHVPGVYKFFDAKERLLYVGKARRLHQRLSHYFQHPDRLSLKTRALMARVKTLSWVEVASENAALVLENELIKAHKPAYNIALRDDKSYYYLVEDPRHTYPALRCERCAKSWQEGVNYYGPYPSSRSVKKWLNQLQKWFLIRQCSDAEFKQRKRPCIQYQLGRCSAPCVGHISERDYGEQFAWVRACLQGAPAPILARCQTNMQEASARLAFEEASFWRDLIAHMQQLDLQGRQQTDCHVDVFAAVHAGDESVYAVGWVRSGIMRDIQAYRAPNPLNVSPAEALSALIPQFYLQHKHWLGVPDRILLEAPIDQPNALEAWLKQQHQHPITLKMRRHGSEEKRFLLQVRQHAHNQISQSRYHPSNALATSAELMQRLRLSESPQHSECLDVSHSAGQHTYASCVVFNAQGPDPKSYRSYRVQSAKASDDYGALKEALLRFYSPCMQAKRPWPDLIIIDGGKGQLSTAYHLWQEQGWPFVPLLSISKGPARKVGEEWLHVPDYPALRLPPHHQALRWVQHMRDEAHRFALKCHRKAHAKARSRSILEQVPGIGPKRRQTLLLHFGGIQALKKASLEQLEKAPGLGSDMAQQLFSLLHENH